MATAGVKPGHESSRRDGGHPQPVIELDDARRPVVLDAIMQASQRPAAGASGPDRIVAMMTATGSYDTLPSNRGRGATMGPPACSDQSSPVVSRSGSIPVLQGLTASWDDWRGQKVFLIRKRSQVRVLDRPLAGIQEFAAFAQFSRIWLLEGRHGRGVRGVTMGPRAVTCEAEKRSLVRASVRWAGAPGTPSAAC